VDEPAAKMAGLAPLRAAGLRAELDSAWNMGGFHAELQLLRRASLTSLQTVQQRHIGAGKQTRQQPRRPSGGRETAASRGLFVRSEASGFPSLQVSFISGAWSPESGPPRKREA